MIDSGHINDACWLLFCHWFLIFIIWDELDCWQGWWCICAPDLNSSNLHVITQECEPFLNSIPDLELIQSDQGASKMQILFDAIKITISSPNFKQQLVMISFTKVKARLHKLCIRPRFILGQRFELLIFIVNYQILVDLVYYGEGGEISLSNIECKLFFLNNFKIIL